MPHPHPPGPAGFLSAPSLEVGLGQGTFPFQIRPSPSPPARRQAFTAWAELLKHKQNPHEIRPSIPARTRAEVHCLSAQGHVCGRGCIPASSEWCLACFPCTPTGLCPPHVRPHLPWKSVPHPRPCPAESMKGTGERRRLWVMVPSDCEPTPPDPLPLLCARGRPGWLPVMSLCSHLRSIGPGSPGDRQ